MKRDYFGKEKAVYFRAVAIMADPLLLEAVGQPPMNTLVPAPTAMEASFKRIIQLRWKLKDALEGFDSHLHRFNEEGNLLGQALYKIHNRFHNDPGYRDLRMLEKSVQKFLGHNFLRCVNNFLSYLPSSLSSQLPTTSMARHAALQLYGAAALLDRVVRLCQLSGVSAFQRIGLGHFWGIAAHQLGMVGRLWTLARHMIRTIHEAFSPLPVLLTLLPGEQIGNPLPDTLESFLPNNDKLLNGINDEDSKKVAPVVKEQWSVDSFLDLGVPVQRIKAETSKVESMDLSVTEAGEACVGTKVEGRKTKMDAFSDLHSLDQLGAFLKQESKMRKVMRKNCITAKLRQEEWKAVKTEVLKSMNERVPNKSIKLCRKILRKAIA